MDIKTYTRRAAMMVDLVPCEYIENTSLAYIDTNIANGAVSWSIDAVISISEAKTGYIIGSRSSSRYYQTIYVNSAMNFVTKMNNITETYSDYTAEIGKKYHLVGTPKSLTVTDEDGQSFTITNSGQFVSNGHSLTLFNLESYVNVGNAFHGRIHSFKLLQNNVLVRDYSPMFKKSMGEYGLNDNLNGVFYGSANNNKFTGK